MGDVEHRDGALLAVGKLGSAAGEELLRVVQQDVWGDPLRKDCNVPAMSQQCPGNVPAMSRQYQYHFL